MLNVRNWQKMGGARLALFAIGLILCGFLTNSWLEKGGASKAYWCANRSAFTQENFTILNFSKKWMRRSWKTRWMINGIVDGIGTEVKQLCALDAYHYDEFYGFLPDAEKKLGDKIPVYFCADRSFLPIFNGRDFCIFPIKLVAGQSEKQIWYECLSYNGAWLILLSYWLLNGLGFIKRSQDEEEFQRSCDFYEQANARQAARLEKRRRLRGEKNVR